LFRTKQIIEAEKPDRVQIWQQTLQTNKHDDTCFSLFGSERGLPRVQYLAEFVKHSLPIETQSSKCY